MNNEINIDNNRVIHKCNIYKYWPIIIICTGSILIALITLFIYFNV